MAHASDLFAKWTPVILLVPLGIAVPVITAAVAQWKVRGTPLSNTLRDACIPAETQSLADFATIVAWNFAPFAVLMVIVGVLARRGSVLSTWLAFLAGVASTSWVFTSMHFQAEQLLLKRAWTASSLSSGLASLYALAVAATVAASVGALTWIAQQRPAPSNSSSSGREEA